MNSYFPDLAASLACYALMAAAYYGWGGFLVRSLKIDGKLGNAFFQLTWIGWCGSILVLQIVNFFVPIDRFSSGVFFLAGVAFCVTSLVRNPPRVLFGARTLAFAGVLAVLTVWAASWAMLPPVNYDSGLYHFNTIRWLNEYPLVPGLGNLHGRFAFNQSFFTYAASLNFYPLFPHGHNVANSFLLLLLFAECLYALVVRPGGEQGDKGGPSALLLVPLCMLPVLVFIAVANSLSSPTPDIAVAVLSLALFYSFARHVALRTSDAATSSLPVILILSATAVTIKLSLLVYASAVSLLSIILVWNALTKKGRSEGFRRHVLYLFPCLILAVWVVKGLILSGYPAYPVPVARLPVDWSVPVEKAANDLAWVKSWARMPGLPPEKVLGSWDWLGPWLDTIGKQTVTVVYPCAAAVVAALLGAVLSFLIPSARRAGTAGPKSPGGSRLPPPHAGARRRGSPGAASLAGVEPDRALWLLAAPPLLGLAYWFFTAPDYRFASALFFLLPISTAYPLLQSARSRRKSANLALMLALFLSVHAMLLDWLIERSSVIATVPEEGYAGVAVAPLVEYKTASGLHLWVPASGDQCWDSPLPCTPYPDPRLRLRGDGLRSGFTVNDRRP